MGKHSAGTGAPQDDNEDGSPSQNILGGIGAGISGALQAQDQQPQMVQAGPQLGAPVNQPQQMQDPYAQNIAALDAQKKKQQVDFFGNPMGSGY